MEDPSSSGGWRFAQCFGDKGEVDDITEGTASSDPMHHRASLASLVADSCIFLLNNYSLYLSMFLTFSSSYAITADIISTVEFDSTGNYLATGDKGGRVVLFERNEMVCIVLMVSALTFPLPAS